MAATVDFETLFTGSGGVFEAAFERKTETYIDSPTAPSIDE
ncbi:hypothetical protein OK016_27405 [Vibrio chagasii]|nr:hypothetical protein [Vibrio chagasii]